MQRQFSNTGLRLLPVIADRYGINRAMSYRGVSGNGVKCRLQYCTGTRYEPRVDRIGHGVKTNRVLLPGNAVIKDITYSTIVRPLGADLHDRIVVYTLDRFISTAIGRLSVP